MAYNEQIADRIRHALAEVPEVEEKKMFGGLAFMVAGKMCITAGADRIMCRINPTMRDEVTKLKGCDTVIMRGRPYKGYVHITQDSFKKEEDLNYWIKLALEYNKIAKSSKK